MAKKILLLACLFACGRAPAGAPEVSQSNSVGSASPTSAQGDTSPPADASAPALPILAAADVPAVPAVPSDCPASAPPAPALHRPGACTVTMQDATGGELWRTQYSWTSGNLVAQSDEQWINWDPNATFWNQYQRTNASYTLSDDGRRTSKDWIHQEVVPMNGGRDSQTWAGTTVFTYGASGRLMASTDTSWAHYLGQEPHRVVVSDEFFQDAAGKIFLTGSTDGFAQVVTVSSVYPNGVVAEDTWTKTNMGSTGTVEHFYDETGALQLIAGHSTDRFGNASYFSTQLQYDGGRLVSVDSPNNWYGDAPPGHTVFGYDPNGNNVERTTTDASGSVVGHWIGVYDAGNNLVCEKDVAGAASYIRTYDYGCF
jgi:hypothetical protein